MTAGADLVFGAGVERLAADFVPISPELLTRPHMRRFFARISLIWALVQLTNAGVTLWLLLSQPLATYVFTKAFVSLIASGTAIAVSSLLFFHSMRRHGVPIRYAAKSPVA